LLKPETEQDYAQSFKTFLAHYNYVAVSAKLFERTKKPSQELTELVAAATHHPEGLKKLVIELPAANLQTQEKTLSPVFIEQLELLKKLGVHHIGYYPDDVYLDQPRLADLQKHFSQPAQP
jgi:biofilm PGA synthesis lipoprotein PgaB